MKVVRFNAKIAEKILPKDETTAIHIEELIGRTAIIILGDARANSPAQAKVQDQYGHTHYVLVEPANGEILKQGQSVILMDKTRNGFQAMKV